MISHQVAGDAATVDVTTTSVGRDTLLRAYTTFFAQVRFTGMFRVVVTVDPAYGVSEEEIDKTVAFLADLPQVDPRVHEVVVERFPRPVGLPSALGVLLAHTTSPVGVHLEDDWEFTAPVDLDGLIADLLAGGGTQIVLSNAHTARGGTFEDPEQAVPVPGTKVPLLRLAPSNWAAQFLPLSPHVHRTERWAPAVARALALTDDDRCVDERIREQAIAEDGYERHRVLWTRDVVARDIGRPWLAAHDRYRALTPAHRGTEVSPELLPARRSGPLTLSRSAELRRRALDVTPGLTHTFHKRPENFADGAYPIYLERGAGALTWDVDGQCYVDLVCALGAATLGHDHPVVANTVREKAGRGLLLSLPTPAEVSAAEALAAAVPGADMVRFLKTGAEACSAAVRLARAATGRDEVLMAGYHGWHDQLVGPSPGVPDALAPLSRRLELDGPEEEERLLERLAVRGDRTATVLLATPYHRTLSTEFLTELRLLCDRTGTWLVLDEVVTGFRLAPGGLGQLRGIRADLMCFSKGLAAGAPLAAVAGTRDAMAGFDRLRVSSTFAGETLSLEVMKAALRYYATSDYYPRIAGLGRQFREGLNQAADRVGLPPIAHGYDPMPCLRFSPDPARHTQLATAFLAGAAERGVLLRRDVNFVSAAHGESHIDFALEVAQETLGSASFAAVLDRAGADQ